MPHKVTKIFRSLPKWQQEKYIDERVRKIKDLSNKKHHNFLADYYDWSKKIDAYGWWYRKKYQFWIDYSVPKEFRKLRINEVPLNIYHYMPYIQ